MVINMLNCYNQPIKDESIKVFVFIRKFECIYRKKLQYSLYMILLEQHEKRHY